MSDTHYRMETELIHGGEGFRSEAREVNIPVFLTSNFVQKSFEDHSGYGYARGNNPTREALEKLVAKLEGGSASFAFASGMAASYAALNLFKAGDTVLVAHSVYGGTYGLVSGIMPDQGVRFKFVNFNDPSELESSVTEDVKGVFIETPSNPTLEVIDLREVAAFCKKHRLLSIADNTFMSPYLQRPLDYGIDVVVESATKYLGGHSDLIGGIAAAKDEGLCEQLKKIQVVTGGIMQPFDAYMMIRSIKTLGVRLDRQVENAQRIADFLLHHDAVTKVRYPGLPDHPGHAVHMSQAKNGGAMLSFDLSIEYDMGRFLDSLKIFIQGASLGGVESLIGHSATTSHRTYPKKQKEETGLSDRLIRVSPGIESAEDLVEDLMQAFAAAKK